MVRKILAFFTISFCAGPLMADINVTPGSGKTVHTDTINSVEYQAIKIIDGTTGGTSSATVTAAGLLKVDASGVDQPVIVSTLGVRGSTVAVVNAVGQVLSVSGSGAFNTTGSTTGVVQVTSPWVVQPVGITTITFNGTAQPVSQATAANLKASVLIDGTSNTVVLGAGTAGIGKLTSNNGVDIGDVDVASVSGNVTVVQPTAASLKSSVLIDGTSNTVQITGTPSVTISGTPSAYVTNVTTSPIQIQSGGGALVSVGYQAGGGSIPVNIVAGAIAGTFTPTAVTTITFNNVAQPVTSSYTIVSTTYAIAVAASFTPPAITTVSWANQGAQAITSSYTVVSTTYGISVAQSGTWTVQPGNTPNTTAWLVETSTIGLNGSTMAVVNAVGQTLAVTGSGAFNMTGSTVGAVQVTNPWVVQPIGVSTAVGNLADNGAAAATNRVGILPGVAQTSYGNGTASTQGRDVSLDVGTDGLLWVASLPALRPESYSASTNTIASAATATDIAGICGNSVNTVLLYAIRASCTQTTAGNVSLQILKRSSADTGVFSTMTAVAQDSNNSVQDSSATFMTANPTMGTLVGHLDNYKLGCMATATAAANDIYISPSDWKMKPIVLRGAAQCVYLNLSQTTVSGSSFTVMFNWIETATITP